MTSHAHDLDLIASLADGSIEADESEARRLIAECAVCRAEFDRQRRMREALAGLPPVVLTDAERHRIRASLLPPTERPRPRQSGVRRPWREALGAVAALLVVAVGIVAVLEDTGESPPTAPLAADAESVGTPEEFAGTPAFVNLGELSSLDLELALDRIVTEESDKASDSARGSGDLGPETTAASESAAGTASAATAAPTCEPPEGSAVVAAVVAVVDGRPIVAFVLDEPAGRRQIILDASTCAPLDPSS